MRTSPFIDSIARRGVLFERCYAPNIPTHPSFTTMLTGKEAITHDIVNIGGGVPIAEGVRLLPEILREHGYATAAVDTMGRHFERGFDRVRDLRVGSLQSSRAAQGRDGERQGPAGDRAVAREQQAVLPIPALLGPAYALPAARRRIASVSTPVTRDPYDPANHSMDEAWNWEPFKWYFHDWMPGVTDADYVINLYDGETAYMDRHLRRVFQALAPDPDRRRW